jgi:thiol-disulfide isomerase/thioredoxin
MKIVAVVAGVVIIILAVGYLTTNAPEGTLEVTNEAPDTMVAEEVSVPAPEEEASMANETIVPTAEVPVAEPGIYATYDATAVAESDAEHILLFFKASWCPSCRALEADILENAAMIPSNVAIFAVDYDTATELKRQYGITRQHSIVEITPTGEAESQVSHGLTLADVLATL